MLEKIQQLLMNLVKDDNKLEIIKNVIDLIKYIYQKNPTNSFIFADGRLSVRWKIPCKIKITKITNVLFMLRKTLIYRILAKYLSVFL